MRVRGFVVGAMAGALMLAGGGALGTSQVLLLPGEDGDQILTVSSDEPGRQSALTLICSTRSGEFGIVLAPPKPGLPPDSAELTVATDGAPIGVLQFTRQAQSLLMIGDGGEGRTTLGKLVRAEVIEIDDGDRKLRFVLREATAQVARYRDSCRL